jgi:MFS family permease
MLSWYRELSGSERKTFWGCFGGWAMDAMDLQLFSFLIPTLIGLWGITRADAGMLGTAALISSAIGGWIGGVLSDRYGRVRVMQGTIIWYAVFTFISGFTNDFNQLLAARIGQGLGFGGEWAAGAVLMGEIIRPQHRGKALGCVQSAYAVGWGAASIISTLFLMFLPIEWGWRSVFFVGALPALLVIYIRRNMHEPPLFEQTRREQALTGEKTGFFTIFKPDILRTTVLASLLALGLQGGSYALSIWLPTFLTTVRHLSLAGTGYSVFIITFGAFCGYLVSGYASDVIGRRKIILIYSAFSFLTVLVYTYLPITVTMVVVLGFPLGFFTVGVYSVFGPFFSELFPTRVRTTGQSFAYNFGRSIGALLVSVVGLMAQVMPLGEAIGAISLGCYVAAVAATLMLPETQGISLDQAGVTHPTRPLVPDTAAGLRP